MRQNSPAIAISLVVFLGVWVSVTRAQTAPASQETKPVPKTSEEHSTGPGLTLEQAIEVCDPEGEQAYLARLRCANNSVPKSERQGSVGYRTPFKESKENVEIVIRQTLKREPVRKGEPDYHILDLFVVTCPKETYKIYMDMYHCSSPTPVVAPHGLKLAEP